jgi:YVTN family beta-propeller protein
MIMSIVLAAALLSPIAAPPGASTDSESGGRLLALSKAEHTMAIVDPVTLKVVARLPVGPDPHEVIASTDGTRAYVSNMGFGGRPHHEINVIDLVEKKVLPNIDTGPLTAPHGLAFAGGKLWFTAQGAKAVGRVDPATGRVEWLMGTGQDWTHMIHVFPGEARICTTNARSATVSILDFVQVQPPRLPAGVAPPGAGPGPRPGGGPPPRMGPSMEWVQAVIPAGPGVEGFDVTPDGRELWGANAQDGTISIIDPAAKKSLATLDARIEGANRLKITPDGKRALVSSLRSGELTVLDTTSRAEVKRLKLGRGASGILIEPDGGRAFVACSPDDRVAIVDLRTLEVTGTLGVGGHPDGLAWAVRPSP